MLYRNRDYSTVGIERISLARSDAPVKRLKP